MNESSNSGQCAIWLKALAESNRLEIIKLLFEGPKTVTVLAEEVGVEIASVSHHLQVLLHAGLVQVTKRGRFALYRMNPSVLLKKGPKHGATFDFGCCEFRLKPGPRHDLEDM